ncbi:hypothetical protein ACTMU2_37200 [Cupriavidus basilensis]
MDRKGDCQETPDVTPRYTISVGDLADLIRGFRERAARWSPTGSVRA